MNNFFKKLTVVLVALAITFSTFGSTGINVARAETDSSTSQISEDQLIKLLTQLISVLQEQIRILRAGADQSIDDNDDASQGLTEAEAIVYTNETVVKIELNDDKSLFTTQKTDRDELVAEIADRYNLSEEDVDGALTLEEEDRASRTDDKDWADDDDDDDEDD